MSAIAARAAVLEDRLDDGAVLAWRARGRASVGAGSSTGSTCTCSAPSAPIAAGADAGAADAADHEREGAVGQLAGVLDLGDRADRRVTAVDPGHEHEPAPGLLGGGAGPLGLVGLERDRDDHLREHDALRERQQGKQLGAGVGLDIGGVVSDSVVSLLGHVVPSRCSGSFSGNTQPTPASASRFPMPRRSGSH